MWMREGVWVRWWATARGSPCAPPSPTSPCPTCYPLLCTEREMLLLKLRAPPGPARTEVMQLAQIFRARVNDVSDRSMTLCVSGDPGKVRLMVVWCLLAWWLACDCGGHDAVRVGLPWQGEQLRRLWRAAYMRAA